MEGREGGLLERRDHVGFPILGDVCTTGGWRGLCCPLAGKGDTPCVYSALKRSQFWLYHS